jgi:hypothetical protein
MKVPFGRKGLIAIGGVAGALAFWRIRSRRRQREELEWEAEVVGAIDEGRGAGEPAGSTAGVSSGA